MPVMPTSRRTMAIHFCVLFNIAEVSRTNGIRCLQERSSLLCRQSERYVPHGCAWMGRGSIRARRIADRNEQIRSSVNLVHHGRAAYSGCAAERRRPEDLACIGIESVDGAVAAETEQQTAGGDDD